MNFCEKNFITKIRIILSSRQRKVIDHPPFSHAAVLVPLFQKDGNCHLLFTKRSDQVKYHKGEISFPGGVVDEEDLELINTALREAPGEMGLRKREIIRGGQKEVVYAYQYGDHIIWGATARILKQFLDLIPPIRDS